MARPGATTTPGCAPTNWREVLRDPAALPDEIRALLEAENAYAEAILAPTRALQRQLVREMRARLQGGRQRAAGAGRALELLLALPPRRPATHLSAGARAAAARRACCSTATRAPRARRSSISAARGHSPDHRKFAWSADDKGSEMHAIRVRDVAGDSDLRRPRREHERRDRLDARFRRAFSISCRTRTIGPGASCCIASGERAAEDLCIFEEADPAWFLALRPTRLGRRAFILVHGHDASEAHVVDLDAPAAPPRADRAAPAGPPLSADGSRRRLLHQDQQRRRARLQDRRRAERGAGRGELARRSSPAKDGRLIESAALFKDYLALLAREDNVPAPDRPRSRRAARAIEIAFEAQTYFLKLETVYEFDYRRSSASAIPRWPAARRPTITTWRRASASWSRSR